MADAVPRVGDEPDSSDPDHYWHVGLVASQSQTPPGQYGRGGLACAVSEKARAMHASPTLAEHLISLRPT